MKSLSGSAVFVLILMAFAPATIWAETTSASATSVSSSSSTPSTYSIKQHFLSQQQARIQSEIREVRRCITNASNSQVLRDYQGNINFVAQTDLNNCSRRLKQLTSQLNSLSRKASQLSQDATVAGYRATSLSRDAARQKRNQLINSLSSQ